MDFGAISLLFVTAALCAVIAKMLRQPLLVGYLFAGFILALLGIVGNIEVFSGLGEIGVTLLLFLVGLEMDLTDLATIGKVALITGVTQITVTTALGYLVAVALGFAPLPALYIGIALCFSSTIVVVKLLSEKKDLGSLYGKISIGFLLVQDLVAVIILMFLAGLKDHPLDPAGIVFIAVKGLFLIVATWVLSKKVLPMIFDKFLASSSELLFIASIAWALGVSTFVGGPLGFTLEIGGFLAGLSLSGLPEHLQIASRARPLRDFFLTIFFMILGTKLVIANIGAILVPSLVFSALVLVGNPLVVLSILGFLGYTRRTSFLSGLITAQVSEFSLILMAMGAALGHVGQRDVAIVIFVAVITMTISTYLILGADKIYENISGYLRFFERKQPKESAINAKAEISGHIVVIGADRTGRAVISFLRKKKAAFLVVDFNPKVFNRLTAEGISCVFGDISDPEVFDQVGIENSKLVLSTISNLSANLFLLENIRRLKERPTTMFTVSERSEGLKLYEKGADYVIVPQRIAGEHIRHVLSVYGTAGDRIRKLGKANFNRLMSK